MIDEHAFWDFDLNKYVFLRADASKYIGDYFNKQTYDSNGKMLYDSVQLVDVEIRYEYTTAWSPVTYGHLCYYVNGMLSMPGATTGLINIFEVDPNTMTIDEEQYLADIAEYGLFTYEEFAEIIAIPEEVFHAFNGQYLKVAIGKGLINLTELKALIQRYSKFFAFTVVEEGEGNEIIDCKEQGNHYGHRNNGKHANNQHRGKDRRCGKSKQ